MLGGLRGVRDQKNIPATGTSKTAHNPAMSIDFPKEEERILARWKEIDAFLTQVELVRIMLQLDKSGTRALRCIHNCFAYCELIHECSQKESHRTPSTMGHPSRRACPIMATSWRRPSRTSSRVTGR
jgi:hypothetical protein